MESGNHQHHNSRNNNLYVHAVSRTMCNYGYFKYYNQPADNTNVYCNRSALSEQRSANATNNIKQWNYRYVEPGNHQHCNGGNYNLYFHSISRSVRNKYSAEHYDQPTNNAVVHRNRSALSK